MVIKTPGSYPGLQLKHLIWVLSPDSIRCQMGGIVKLPGKGLSKITRVKTRRGLECCRFSKIPYCPSQPRQHRIKMLLIEWLIRKAGDSWEAEGVKVSRV